MSTKTISNKPEAGDARPGGNRTLIVVAAVVIVVIAGALLIPRIFGGDDSNADGYQLVTAGTLTIATEGTYRPFSYHDEGTGDLIGYDVEIAQAVADKLGLEARFEETQWDAIFAGLDGGRFDLIANQVSITEERLERYLFSDPYTVSPGVLVIQDGNTEIASFEDLDGQTTAQSLTSNWYELAESYGANVEAVEGWAQAVALLQDGRIDATINDRLTVLDHETVNGPTGLRIVAEADDPSRNAFALTQGNEELVADINEALAELSEDGTIAAIGEKYFGQDVSR